MERSPLIGDARGLIKQLWLSPKQMWAGGGEQLT